MGASERIKPRYADIYPTTKADWATIFIEDKHACEIKILNIEFLIESCNSVFMRRSTVELSMNRSVAIAQMAANSLQAEISAAKQHTIHWC